MFFKDPLSQYQVRDFQLGSIPGENRHTSRGPRSGWGCHCERSIQCGTQEPVDLTSRLETSGPEPAGTATMSAEVIAIIAMGAALVGVQVTLSLWIVSWLRALDGRVSYVEQRMARLEGLIEGAGQFRQAELSEAAGA